MSETRRTPYQKGITLEEARAGARAALATLEWECNTEADRALEEARSVIRAPGAVTITAEVERAADHDTSYRSSIMPHAAAHSSFNPHRLVFHRHGTPADEHAPDNLFLSYDMNNPSTDVPDGHDMADSFSPRKRIKHADRLGRESNDSSSLATTSAFNGFGSTLQYAATGNFQYEERNIDPALRSRMPTPNYGGPGYFPDPHPNVDASLRGHANNDSSIGYYNSDDVPAASALPARFAAQYVSPYTSGSERYYGATGYPHGRGRHVGELVPGTIAMPPAPSQHVEDPDNFYPELPQGDEQSYCYPELTTQQSLAGQTTSNFGGSSIYRSVGSEEQQLASDEYLEPEQYWRYLEESSTNKYMDSNNQQTQPASMHRGGMFGPPGSDTSKTMASRKTAHKWTEPVERVERVDNKGYKRGPKRTFGSLYGKDGKLPAPVEHYRDYMNGLREMNGKLAGSQLAPSPCRDCAMNGLTCRILPRDGDHGQVFTKMRKPWRNHEVSNYVVCGNCWAAAGAPQSCSFWFRPAGKERPARRNK